MYLVGTIIPGNSALETNHQVFWRNVGQRIDLVAALIDRYDYIFIHNMIVRLLNNKMVNKNNNKKNT